ncbi:variable surface protein [Plasmodium gonderi]|uniref:Variable surface protein n=1 Tax=Plasmodium gonderi TaxID=77519 RepID=A0A1Y1JQS8_PLAGO|nr:variable surface protein [Plasmodium gonderi]GAW84580.1 variable surface protein [Plasmodium gonderi]
MLKRENWKEFGKIVVSFREELPSEKFYKTLDDLKGFNEYTEYCKFLTSFKNESAVRNYCARILKYLSSNKELRSDSNVYDICQLLNYWLANRLSIIAGYNDPNNLWKIFGYITNIWNNFIMDTLKKPESETCNPLMGEIIPHDWRKRKELYEYYVDYNYLSLMPIYKKGDEEYCTFIRNKILLYNYFRSICIKDTTDFCEKFNSKYISCDPNNLLHGFECEKEIDEKGLLERRERELQRIPSHNITMSLHESQSPGMSIRGTQTSSVLQLIYNSFIPLKKASAVVLGIIGISTIYGFLYKFTPVRNWIHRRFANKKDTRCNIYSEFNAAFDYADELHNPHYKLRDGHYIGYHSN